MATQLYGKHMISRGRLPKPAQDNSCEDATGKGNKMENQKLENLLNLALETPEALREKSLNLNVGYEAASRTWELIVKYNGNLSALAAMGIGVEELLAGYAVLTVPEEFVDEVAGLPEIEYVEKPKRLFFAVDNLPMDELSADRALEGGISVDYNSMEQAKEASCILPVTVREPYLNGEGVIVGVIDSGERVILLSG